jgi:hypothetical protein
MRNLIVITFALAIGGCNSEPQVDVKNASVEEVADKVAEAGGSEVMFRPGLWQSKVTVEDVSIPGMPPEAQAQMKGFYAKMNNTIDSCLTPEDAKKPGGKFFGGKDADNCKYDHFTMRGGKIDAVMRCTGEGSGEMKMTIAGTYTPESSTTHSDMEISSKDGTMRIKALSEAKRAGECTGKES